MGNYRFRLSDINPNVWFQKLIKPKQKHQTSSSSSSLSSFSYRSSSLPPVPPPNSDHRKSYYVTRDLNSAAEPARKSYGRRRRSTKTNRPPPPPLPRSISSPASACNCRGVTESVWTTIKQSPEEYGNSLLSQTSGSSDNDSILPEYGSDHGLTTDTFNGTFSRSTSCCKCSNDDTEINVNENDKDIPLTHEFDAGDLPPIITRKEEPTKIQRTSAEFAEKNVHGSLSHVKVVKQEHNNRNTTLVNHYQNKKSSSPVTRRYLPNPSSPGTKLRAKSPRIANPRRIQGGRKSGASCSSTSRSSSAAVSESFAVVKTSRDPGKDFKESMVEMITQNNIRACKDLEELLACYLSLNSDEYHELIIGVFRQIWSDYVHIHLK